MEATKTIDNVSCRLGEDIAGFLKPESCVYVASSGFSLSAFEHLADELESVKEIRFVFTAPAFVPQTAVKEKLKRERREFFIPGVGEASLLGTEYEIRLRNRLMQKAIAKRCGQWIKKGNVKFMSVAEYGQIQDMFIVETTMGNVVYLPFNGFTADTLGYEHGPFASAISTRMSGAFADPFRTRFREVWAGGGLRDVTEQLSEYVSNVYRDNEPELVYFLVLKYLFEEAIRDFDADTMPNTAIGYEDSLVWKKLFDFQHDAAIAIINKLEKYNGCILADSVGLGKTFTALAVMRYYELRNKNVLVLCPKKLEANWNVYNKPTYKNNPFAAEKLRYDVLCHTDIQRERGQSNGTDLSRVNWGGYDLVVIDESHNFRNDKSDYIDKETRYQTLMRKVMREGVKTKVLMLSATPVNNRFNDLRNQLRLAYGGGTDEMNRVLGASGRTVEAIFRDAERAFDAWSDSETGPRTAEALFKALPSDFLELLDAVTIARSRKHIERFYNTEAIGKFPTHLPAQSEMCPISADPNAVKIKELNDALIARSFCVYTPSQYILPSRQAYYDERTATHTRRGGTIHQAGREYTLKNLMVINVLKRLESSVFSFRKTLTAILRKNEGLLRWLESGDSHAERQSGLSHAERRRGGEISASCEASGEARLDIDNLRISSSPRETDEFEGLEDEEELETLSAGRVPIAREDLDVESYKRDLKADIESFRDILKKIEPIDAAHDAKLKRLKDLIVEKATAPFNAGNRKLLVFSAFADTASYLYQELGPKLAREEHMACGLVTGKDAPKATLKLDAADFQEVLSRFSPISKEWVGNDSRGEEERRSCDVGKFSRRGAEAQREVFEGNKASGEATLPDNLRLSASPRGDDLCVSASLREIDVLFATDCVSEGQNLQDCDCVVNYDIHWNPVRIIQRFGRVDRIGSKNASVKLVNFWPDVDLNEYINLTERVKNRMQAVNIAGGGHDNPLAEGDGVDFRDEPLTRMMHGEIVDMESLNTGVSITDLGLNEYALALKKYVEGHPAMDRLPPGINAVVEAKPDEGLVPGVVFFLRNRDEKLRNEANYFHPFYAVYLASRGEEERRSDMSHAEVRRGGELSHAEARRGGELSHAEARRGGDAFGKRGISGEARSNPNNLRLSSSPREKGWYVYKDSTQGKAIIELLRKGCEGKSEPIAPLCKAFNKETRDGFRMETYSALLSQAIETIAAKKDESDVDSLFNSTETTALNGDCAHLEAFELMAFFVIKDSRGEAERRR